METPPDSVPVSLCPSSSQCPLLAPEGALRHHCCAQLGQHKVGRGMGSYTRYLCEHTHPQWAQLLGHGSPILINLTIFKRERLHITAFLGFIFHKLSLQTWFLFLRLNHEHLSPKHTLNCFQV